MPSAQTTHEAPWRAGLRGARANLAPGLVLQCLALGLVLAYYFHAPTHAAINHFAAFGGRLGVWFGVITTGVFGGLLPLLYMKARRSTRDHYTWTQGAALIAFWGYKGIEIGLWYRLLAWDFGEGTDVKTIAIKTVLDQFGYSLLIAVPTTVLAYDWCERRFSFAALIADLRAPDWYQRRALPMLIANLGVWLPAVCLIYALPTALQLPLQNLVLCFFTLIVAYIARRQTGSNPITEARKSGGVERSI